MTWTVRVFAAALACVSCTGAIPEDEPGRAEEAASIQAIALVGVTASGLDVKVEQWGNVADRPVTLARPAALSLKSRDGTLLAFREPGDPSSHVRGPFDFYAHVPHLGVTVVTRLAIEAEHGTGSAGARALVAAFSGAAYDDPARVEMPTLIDGWNGLVLVSELDDEGRPTSTRAESIHFRKVRR